MNFKLFLTFNENIQENFDNWCDTLEKYAKGDEKVLLNRFKSFLSPFSSEVSLKDLFEKTSSFCRVNKTQIINILKQKNLENFNWFSFSLGCFYAYAELFHGEDLEAAIENTRRRIDNRSLSKAEIGSKGWFTVGYESKEHVAQEIIANQAISNREKERMRKAGKSFNEDERLIRLLAKEGDYTLYFCPKLIGQESTENSYNYLTKNQETVDSRHRILCKYGKGGEFCTASPSGSYHRMYIQNDIYILHVNDSVRYQFVSCNDSKNLQFMNVKNKRPDYVSPKEYSFLIKYAPIGCYNLKIGMGDYADVLDAIRKGSKEEIKHFNPSQLGQFLLNALEEEKYQDVKLLIKTGFEVCHSDFKNATTSRFILDEFIRRLESFSDQYIQEILSYILDIMLEDKVNAFVAGTETVEEILKNANIENIKKTMKLSKNSSHRLNLINRKNYIGLIKRFDSSDEIIETLLKEDLTNLPVCYMLAVCKDKKKIFELAKDKINKLTSSEIISLLIGQVNPELKHGANWWGTGENNEILPGVKIKNVKLISELLGSEIISKLPSDVVEQQYSRKSSEFRNLDTEQKKNLIEAVAKYHKDLSADDIRQIIISYKNLPGMHKAVAKITDILGKKNMKKLDRWDRATI